MLNTVSQLYFVYLYLAIDCDNPSDFIYPALEVMLPTGSVFYLDGEQIVLLHVGELKDWELAT